MITSIMAKFAAEEDVDDKKEKSSETRAGKNISRIVGGLAGANFGPWADRVSPEELASKHKINKYKTYLDAGDLAKADEYYDKVVTRWANQHPTAYKMRMAKSLGAIGAGVVAGDVAYRLGHKALDAYKGRFKDNN